MSLSDVIKNWDLPEVTEEIKIKDNAIKLICNDESKYFLKIRDNVDKIHTEEELLKYLFKNNIPVSVPLRTKDNFLYKSVDNKYYCMYEFIEGEHFQYKSYEDTKKAVSLYGCVLGKLHNALNKYKGKSDNIDEMDLYKQIFDFAIPKITDKLRDLKINNILKELSVELRNTFNSLQKQYIHRDFHGENILFKNNKWVGLIDFDLCVKGFKVFDIGYILTSILSTDFDNEEFRKNWLTLIPIIIDSYIKENELKENERKALWHIFLSIQLIFVAYFVSVDNTKLAKQNLDIFYWLHENRDSIDSSLKNI